MKKLLIILSISLISSYCYSQEEEIRLYQNIISKSDSLIKVGKIEQIDTLKIFKEASKIDEKHPSQYFDAMANYLNNNEFNEASFLFYVGIMRYKFYNSTNPKYKAGEDGALLASLKMVLGEPIQLYMRSDVDNFLNILNLSKNYYQKHDYKFFPKKNNEQKYEDQIKYIENMVLTIEKDRLSIKKIWEKEREEYKNMLGDQ